MMKVVLQTAVALALLGAWTGCAGGGAVSEQRETGLVPVPVSQAAHTLALQHFVDGSVFEMKGDYARAVLEYQDALRYEKSPGVYFATSKCYSLLGKHALAIEAGREAVRLAPDQLTYRRSLAETYTNAYELDSAADQYAQIVARDSNAIDAWYALARLYQSRKPSKALEIYAHIIAQFGPDWNVLMQMAESYTKVGAYDKAAGVLKQMMELDPTNRALKKNLAEAYSRAGRFDDALATYKELLEENPENLEYKAELAGIYLFRKQYSEAEQHVNAILAHDSVAIEIKLRIGELYFGQMEKDSTIAPYAKTVFERIRDSHPEDWRAYWFLGAIEALTHDDSASIGNFRKVTELASWNPDGWVYLSSIFMRTNSYQEMVKVLDAAVKVLPDDFRVNFFLGYAYSRLGQNVEAVRYLEHAREINPKDVDAIGQLAMVYDGMKRYEESDSLYEEALRMNPENHLILNNYGYSLAERGVQLDRALEMATKAITAQPDNASYLDTMGWVFYWLGRYDEAEKYVKMALDKGEANAVVYEHLGDIYYRKKDLNGALEQWNAALKIDPANAGLKEKIARGAL
jgi:tetratricopeptide (TPR) repeat protein